jgi:hypothetical protein
LLHCPSCSGTVCMEEDGRNMASHLRYSLFTVTPQYSHTQTHAHTLCLRTG